MPGTISELSKTHSIYKMSR